MTTYRFSSSERTNDTRYICLQLNEANLQVCAALSVSLAAVSLFELRSVLC